MQTSGCKLSISQINPRLGFGKTQFGSKVWTQYPTHVGFGSRLNITVTEIVPGTGARGCMSTWLPATLYPEQKQSTPINYANIEALLITQHQNLPWVGLGWVCAVLLGRAEAYPPIDLHVQNPIGFNSVPFLAWL